MTIAFKCDQCKDYFDGLPIEMKIVFNKKDEHKSLTIIERELCQKCYDMRVEYDEIPQKEEVA